MLSERITTDDSITTQLLIFDPRIRWGPVAYSITIGGSLSQSLVINGMQ